MKYNMYYAKFNPFQLNELLEYVKIMYMTSVIFDYI